MDDEERRRRLRAYGFPEHPTNTPDPKIPAAEPGAPEREPHAPALLDHWYFRHSVASIGGRLALVLGAIAVAVVSGGSVEFSLDESWPVLVLAATWIAVIGVWVVVRRRRSR